MGELGRGACVRNLKVSDAAHPIWGVLRQRALRVGCFASENLRFSDATHAYFYENGPTIQTIHTFVANKLRQKGYTVGPPMRK